VARAWLRKWCGDLGAGERRCAGCCWRCRPGSDTG
jgi:hypothetical protein